MNENSRCSTLFHFEVPGGKWQSSRSSPASSASFCRQTFQRCTRGLLPPPQSAVIVSRLALGNLSRPRCSHHPRMLATENSAVSTERPTDTYPSLLAMSYTP